jgi:hypothetical protein
VTAAAMCHHWNHLELTPFSFFPSAVWAGIAQSV